MISFIPRYAIDNGISRYDVDNIIYSSMKLQRVKFCTVLNYSFAHKVSIFFLELSSFHLFLFFHFTIQLKNVSHFTWVMHKNTDGGLDHLFIAVLNKVKSYQDSKLNFFASFLPMDMLFFPECCILQISFFVVCCIRQW